MNEKYFSLKFLKNTRRIILSIPIFLVVALISGCATGSRLTGDSYSRAQKLFDLGRYDEARKNFNQYMSELKEEIACAFEDAVVDVS